MLSLRPIEKERSAMRTMAAIDVASRSSLRVQAVPLAGLRVERDLHELAVLVLEKIEVPGAELGRRCVGARLRDVVGAQRAGRATVHGAIGLDGRHRLES